jgi:hypothetical protein
MKTKSNIEPKPLQSSAEIEAEITRLHAALLAEGTAKTKAAADGDRSAYDAASVRCASLQTEISFLQPQLAAAKERERQAANDRAAEAARERACKRAAIVASLLREAAEWDRVCLQMVELAGTIDKHRHEAFVLSDSVHRERPNLDFLTRAADAAGLGRVVRIGHLPKPTSLVAQFETVFGGKDQAASAA